MIRMPPGIRVIIAASFVTVLAVMSFLRFPAYGYAMSMPENGVHREYYPNGVKKLETVFKKGHLVRSRMFYENGRLMSEFRYKPGSIESKRTFYENGVLRSEWTRKTGIIKFYNRQGTLTHESKWEG